MDDNKLTDAVRTALFEVKSVNGEWSPTTKRWMSLSDQCKQIANCIWQTWLVWHVQNGSAEKLRGWLDKRAEAGKKEAGPCPIQAVPNDLSKLIYRTLVNTFPSAHTRVVVLIQNMIIRDIKTHKASKGALPGWSAILLCHQSIPSSTRPHPIPFDKANGVIIPVEKENFRLRLRQWRVHVEGKTFAASVEDTLELHCRGRKVQSQVSILRKIVSGEYAFRGSELFFSTSKRKWFVHFCYRIPAKDVPVLDKTQTAILRPSLVVPWKLRLPGGMQTRWIAGRGHYIAPTRQKIFLQRRSRSGNYVYANTNAKGHGWSRAHAWRWKLQRRWNDFVKSCNHITTAKAVEVCVERGIGRLVYLQPMGSRAESRFLSMSGKSPDWRDATTWQYQQVETFLKYKCKRAGVEFVCEKSEPNPIKRKSGKRVA